MIHSRKYEVREERQLKRNNSTVFYMDGPQIKIGGVEYFFKDNEQGYAVISRLDYASNLFKHQESRCKMEQLNCVKQTNCLIVVKLSSIVERGIFIEVADKAIVGKLPNRYIWV